MLILERSFINDFY